jgi:general secretion pathway protein I
MEPCVLVDERPFKSGFPSWRRSVEHGFTLIELMVALAVFSLVALTLIKLQGAILRNSGEIATRNVGQIVAHNLAVGTLTDPRAPSLGLSEGTVVNGGQNWRWTRLTKETADPKLVRIDIAVVDQTGRSAGALTLARPMER